MKLSSTTLATALLVSTQFVATGYAHSAAIGMPESTLRIGYGAGFARLSIDDPDGPTESKSVFQPLEIIATDWLMGDLRYWAEFFYQETTLDASQTSIGQTVDQYGLRLSAQKNFHLLPRWAPWLGMGVDLSLDRYRKRHTTDKDGFLYNQLPNRNEKDFGLIINLVNETELNQNWDMGVKLEQRFSTSDGVKRLSFSASILRRF